ncbi:hypothetical protein Patl1_01643 [Pistacia atlantica]|uniref:Uncharacterized protein n=1 Tax=Pistacia atlantica TaxID=434234 RepID=A0ACC1C822_9ROSI|nr:hypothetical protein Patl1_01643 [Pistacia atlantica]
MKASLSVRYAVFLVLALCMC